MSYILMSLGLLLGGYGVLSYIRIMPRHALNAMLKKLALSVICLVLIFLVISERMSISLALFAALWPIVVVLFWIKPQEKTVNTHKHSPNDADDDHEMERDEALNLLGLEDQASLEDIRKAHKRLMTKVHPDRGGTSALAAKINMARDILLT